MITIIVVIVVTMINLTIIIINIIIIMTQLGADEGGGSTKFLSLFYSTAGPCLTCQRWTVMVEMMEKMMENRMKIRMTPHQLPKVDYHDGNDEKDDGN